MKFPQHITKFTLTITKSIVIGVVFVIGVMVGIINIISNEIKSNKDAKTRVVSAQSKIVPKNTKNKSTLERDDFGYPDRSVRP